MVVGCGLALGNQILSFHWFAQLVARRYDLFLAHFIDNQIKLKGGRLASGASSLLFVLAMGGYQHQGVPVFKNYNNRETKESYHTPSGKSRKVEKLYIE